MSEQKLLDRMLQLISQKLGGVIATQLHESGIAPHDLHLLLVEHVLREDTSDRYVLIEPLVNIDVFILSGKAYISDITASLLIKKPGGVALLEATAGCGVAPSAAPAVQSGTPAH